MKAFGVFHNSDEKRSLIAVFIYGDHASEYKTRNYGEKVNIEIKEVDVHQIEVITREKVDL